MPTYRLTKLIDIVEPQESGDFDGAQSVDVRVGRVWSDVRAISGNERVVAQQVYAGATYSIVIRKQRQSFSPTMCCVVNGEKYPITAITETDDGMYLRLLCSKQTDSVGGWSLR